jgi:PAS domain-containing protein
MSEQKHHEEFVEGLHKQLKEIFDSSKQAIYLYLDDNHKVCNKKFAEMQGFSSPEEWAKVENPLEAGVDKMSQCALLMHIEMQWKIWQAQRLMLN